MVLARKVVCLQTLVKMTWMRSVGNHGDFELRFASSPDTPSERSFHHHLLPSVSFQDPPMKKKSATESELRGTALLTVSIDRKSAGVNFGCAAQVGAATRAYCTS